MDPHISFSQVNQYLRCGLAYSFKYRLGLQPEFLPAPLVFGTSFHRAAELFYRARMEGRADPTLDELHETFRLAWQSQTASAPEIRYKEGEDAQTQDDLARRMLSAFLEHLQDRHLKILAVEQRFSVDLAAGLPPLVGYLDVVEQTPNGDLCITEIKTSAKKYPEASAFDSLQLASYSAIAKALGHEGVVQVKYLVVTKTKSPAVQELMAVLDDPDVHRFTRIAHDVHEGIEKGVFVPNPGWQCAGCQWQQACREELAKVA